MDSWHDDADGVGIEYGEGMEETEAGKQPPAGSVSGCPERQAARTFPGTPAAAPELQGRPMLSNMAGYSNGSLGAAA